MSTDPKGFNQFEGWSEPDFRALLESIPEALIVVDGGGRIVLANAQTCGAFGYAADELNGLDVDLLLPARHRRSHAEERARFQARPRTRSIGQVTGLQALRKDGSEFPVEIALRPLPTPGGELVCTVIRDISERRRIERSLAEKNSEVERADRARDRFFAGLSHELRTPLNAIIGFTGTLLMRLPGPLTAGQESQLQTVQSSARQLVSLINDLLDVAKLDADEIQPHREWFDCRLLIDELAGALRPAAAAKGLQLGVAPAAGAVMLFTDRQILRQILVKLMENAVDFTVAGGVQVEAARVGGADAGEFRVTVVDTGPGIPRESLARMFEPFARLDHDGVLRGAGSGLGLHLSRKLAGLLGGTLDCTSEPGCGSSVVLRLPAR